MGHWTTLDTPHGPVAAWHARPVGRPRGGLVVIQEIFGVNEHMRQVGDDYQVCGVGQPGGGCATLSDFTFSGGSQVQAFDYGGTPVDDLVGGDGPTAELNAGKIAGVELRETFLNPKDRRLYVAMSVLWSPEVSPDTTGQRNMRVVTVAALPTSPTRKSDNPPGKCRTSSAGVSSVISEGSHDQRISTPRNR